MAFCANCGKPVDGRFCQNCGTPMDAPAGAPGGQAPGNTPPAYTPPPPGVQAGGMQENVACALCYCLWFFSGIFFLAVAPYNQNPKIRFHAFQAIFFNLALFAIFVVTVPLGLMLPFPLSTIVWLLRLACWVGGFFLWLFLMWKAYNNERVELPVIGSFAAQQAGN